MLSMKREHLPIPQGALALCPPVLRNELGLTSNSEDSVPPDDDFNTVGYCENIAVEENEANDSSSKSSIETKPDASPQLPKKSITNSTLTSM
ncbi:Protein Aster-B [Lemmus lemmus]